MGIDIGSVEATLKLNDQFSAILNAAGGNLSEFLRKVIDVGSKSKDGNDKLEASYRRLAASLDPAIAAEQKLESAHKTLDQALQKNLIDQEKYNQLLDKAREKYEHAGQSSSLFSQLISKLGGVTGEGGELVAKLTEHVAGLGEKLEELGKDGESVTGALAGMAGGLAAFVPLLLAAAAAAVTFGAAFVAFDFLKEATVEGLKTQGVILQLENSLRANGAAAGYSSKMIIEEAESLALLSGQTKEAIIQGFALETRFTKIGHDIFPRVAEAAVNMSRALPGKSVEEAFSTLSRVMEGDARGLMALKEAGLVLLPSQKAYLLQLSEQGKITEYQNLLMDILEGKLGKAAETYGSTLPGAIDRSKFALTEFKEGIADGVIPILEDLGSGFIKMIGHSDDLKTAWKNIAKEAREMGETVSDVISKSIGGWTKDFLELKLMIDGVRLSILGFLAEKDKFHIGSMIGSAGEAFAHPIDMFMNPASPAIAAVKAAQDSNSSARLAEIKELQESMKREGDLLLSVEKDLINPRHALTGTDDKPPGGKGGPDIPKKTKDIKGLVAAINEWDKITQAFNNHITDQNGKLDEQISEQEALQRALAKGLEAYGLEEQQQKRNAAIFAVVTKADQEYRTEVEKLTEIIKKLHDAHDTKDEQEKIKQLADLKAQYEGTRLAIQGKAAAEVDAKSKTAETLTQLREVTAAEQVYSKLEAEIADALNGTTSATEAAEKARAVYQAGVKASLVTDAAGIKMAKDQAAADYDLTKQDEKLLAVAKEYGRLQAQVNLGTLQAHIDTNLSERLQTIQATFLDSLTDGGKRTVEQGIELFRQLAGGDEEVLKQMLVNVQADIGALYDQAQAKKISGISKSPLDTYRDQQAEYQRLLDTGMSSEADAHKAMHDASTKFWSDEVNAWKSAMDNLAKIGGKVGEIFSSIGQVLGGIQQAQATGSSISGAVTASGVGGSANNSYYAAIAGTIGTVVAIFAEIYAAVDAHIKKVQSESYGTGNSSFLLLNGVEGTSRIDNEGQKVINEIRKLVKNLGDALGGTVTDLDAIGIQVRNDGKYTAAYVKDIFIGHFATVDEAIQAALTYELENGGLKLKGVSDLITQGLKSFTNPDFSSLMDFINQLKQISDMSKSQGQISLESTLKNFDALWQTLSKLPSATDAVTQGFNNLSIAEDSAWQQWKDSITGRQQSAAELLKIKQQEGEMFNAEREMRLADLALRKLDLQQQLDILKAKAGAYVPGREGPGIPTGGGNPAQGEGSSGTGNSTLMKTASLATIQGEIYKADLNLKTSYLKAQADALPAQASIYDAQIGMIQAQIDAIAKIIAAMPDAIDIPSIRLPNTGGAGGKTPAQQFDQQLKDIIAQGYGPAQKALYDYNKQLADLADQYKHNKVSAKDYQDALAELKKEFQAGLLATARGYAGKGNDQFSQKLADGQKFFADLEKMGSAKSGIPNWLEKILKGEFLDEMKKDWQSRVNDFMGMTNPMDAINANAKTLTDDLNALAAATGMSADQIKAAKDLIAQGVDYQKQNAVNGILDNLFGYLKDDAAYAGKASELKKKELDIQFKLWEFQLKSLGAWDADTQKLFRDAHDAADAAADASNSANQAANAASRLAQSEDPWALLKSYTDAALPPLTVQLNKIYSDFAIIIATFGQTSAVMNAETSAIQAAFKQAENGLDKFYDSLNQGAASGLTIDQQYQAAKATYQQVLAEVQAGNYTHIGELSGDAQTLTQLMAQEFDTSTQGYADMRAQILAELGPILQLAGITPPGIVGTVGTSGGTLSGSASLIANSTADISNSLQSMNANQSSIANAAQSLATSADSIRQLLASMGSASLAAAAQQIRYNP